MTLFPRVWESWKPLFWSLVCLNQNQSCKIIRSPESLRWPTAMDKLWSDILYLCMGSQLLYFFPECAVIVKTGIQTTRASASITYIWNFFLNSQLQIVWRRGLQFKIARPDSSQNFKDTAKTIDLTRLCLQITNTVVISIIHTSN